MRCQVVSLPPEGELIESFSNEFKRLIEREIYPRVSRLQAQIEESQGSPKLVNKLGVLYARYGLVEQAEKQFRRILAKDEYVPALYNLGNLHFLRKELKEALRYYERAGRASPDNPKVVLSIARVSHELENYGMAREAYSRLKELSPDLASQFAYLDLRGEEAGRAADAAGVKEVMLWEEE